MRLFLSIICLLVVSAATENSKASAIGAVLTNTRSTGCNADAKIKYAKKRSALKPISRTSVKEAKAANRKAQMQEGNSTNSVLLPASDNVQGAESPSGRHPDDFDAGANHSVEKDKTF